jgi:hypothetical protein
VSGQAAVNNSMLPAGGGSTTEIGSGSLAGTAILQLRLYPSPSASERCVYQIRYMDDLSYTTTLTSPPGPITPPPQSHPLTTAIGVARSIRKEVGPPPSAGALWTFTVSEQIPGRLVFSVPDPDDDLPALPFTHGYFPVTTIGASLFSAAGNPDASIGTAALQYNLVSR